MILTISSAAQVASVKRALADRGVWVASTAKHGDAGTVLLVTASHSAAVRAEDLQALEGVVSVATTPSEHPLVDRAGPHARVGGVVLGEGAPAIFAGPCSVESEEHARHAAATVAAAGATFLRGGAYKPRTSPYAFQGHGEPALRWLRKAADAVGLRVVTEVLAEPDVPLVTEYADLVQVGARTMHSYALLKAVGRAGKPVLLKRGMAATIEEWLLAGEYLLSAGAPSVVFCERGVRGFDPSTRNLLDLGAVALLAHVHRVPVVVDPSHAAGRRDLVAPLALAGVAAGACGVMVEMHDEPGRALSDGPQALSPGELQHLSAQLLGPSKPSSLPGGPR